LDCKSPPSHWYPVRSEADDVDRLTLCGVYYYFWINVIPKYKGYEYRQTIVEFEDGTITHKLVQVPKAELADWDVKHDASGRLRREEAN
jgi:hypothetical protein